MTLRLIILFLALLADRFIGEPEWLWKRIPHPVVWFGSFIEAVERLTYPDTEEPGDRKRAGVLALLILLFASALVGWALAGLFAAISIAGVVLEIGVVSIFIAQKSLADHVAAVADGLRSRGLAGGRDAVRKIVGRDPEDLDEAGIARAAIESLAENTSDGVVAPAFWYVVFGLPGLIAYKMLNTADSMIGHRSERYREFGSATANCDDWANWVPARMTGFVVVLTAWIWHGRKSAADIFDTMLREARLHRSPNAGWPEAAFGAVLGIALGGPRSYDGKTGTDPYVNAAGRTAATAGDIDSALVLFWRCCTVLAGLVLVLAFLG